MNMHSYVCKYIYLSIVNAVLRYFSLSIHFLTLYCYYGLIFSGRYSDSGYLHILLKVFHLSFQPESKF